MIAQDWFISAFIADSLWLVATAYYIYITYLGYKGEPPLPAVHNVHGLLAGACA